jgi:flagellar biosynthetic protein FlhB
MSTSGEKTYAPTEKRQRDASLKGDVLRSRELGTAAAMLVGAGWFKLAGPWLLDALAGGARAGLTWDRASLENFAPNELMVSLLMATLPPVILLALAVLLATLVSQLSFGGGRWVGANMLPKPSRLNPLSGIKRMFGTQGWIEMAKGIAKVLLLGGIAYYWSLSHLGPLLAMGRGTLATQLAQAWEALTSLLFALTGGLVVIALIDFPIQFLRRTLRLRMSQQELRDENRESEGAPEKKAAIRGRQRQLAMGGIQRSMREAQFVLTNPSHYAVAMAYDPLKAAAPIVVAKGRGEKARAMRELAAELALPTLEYPALARSVYFTTRENQVIREELYGAVAGVLAFVFSLKRGEHPPAPAVEVPIALRFDTEGRPDPKAIT